MDDTYFIAAFIALVVGFFASLIFVLSKGRSKLRLIFFALIASLVINGSVLINWTYVSRGSAGFLVLDFAFIATYSLVGCIIGASPVLVVHSIRQWQTKRVE